MLLIVENIVHAVVVVEEAIADKQHRRSVKAYLEWFF